MKRYVGSALILTVVITVCALVLINERQERHRIERELCTVQGELIRMQADELRWCQDLVEE